MLFNIAAITIEQRNTRSTFIIKYDPSHDNNRKTTVPGILNMYSSNTNCVRCTLFLIKQNNIKQSLIILLDKTPVVY